MKNFIDVVITGLAWYLIGFGIAFGDTDGGNGFIGTRYYCLSGIPPGEEGTVRTRWWFQFTFAAVSTTILSGSLAGRSRFEPYLIWSFFYAGFIYALAAHWLWSTNGWLSPQNLNLSLPFGAIDYSGGAIVHILGGTCSLIAAKICGPRMGRFDPEWEGDKPGTLRTFRSLWSGLGTFLLWFGWYGFNPGSSMRAINSADVNALTAINSTISPCAGAIMALFCQYIAKGNWDIGKTCNGLLSGLVAITPACAVVSPWAAFVIGSLGGIFYYLASILLVKLGIDDPVDATPVHCTNGAWGMLAIGLFADQEAIKRAYGRAPYWGAFMGGGGMLFGLQFLCCVVIILWATVWSFTFFYLVNSKGYLRVTPEIEKKGLDVEHMEMTAENKSVFLGRFQPYTYEPGHSKGGSQSGEIAADKDVDMDKLDKEL